MLTNSIRVSAPGKIILFGEHAVVHGQPAIAVPLAAVQVTVEAEAAAHGTGIIINAPDAHQTLRITDTFQPNDSPLHTALAAPVQLALRHASAATPDLTLTVRSTIPIASGLGSGAALATALIRATLNALGHTITNDELNPLVFEIEKLHHGTPSGIDNTVIVYQQPVYFRKEHPAETFPIARPFELVVADTGVSSPTHISVADVRHLYELKPERVGGIFARIGELALAARHAIESGETMSLGPIMDENHDLLAQLTVSSPELDQLCQSARSTGARGAKLSGGGRGGNMIALVESSTRDSVMAALREAGARHIIHTVVI